MIPFTPVGLTDSFGRSRRILYVDQTTTSGVSLLVWELVFRAFHGDATGPFITVAHHTADSMRVVREHNFIDTVGAVGIWPQENSLECYDGLFLDIDGSGVRYRTSKTATGRTGTSTSAARSGSLDGARVIATSSGLSYGAA
jgi:hypothetical protein